jgi:hypothetical protein
MAMAWAEGHRRAWFRPCAMKVRPPGEVLRGGAPVSVPGVRWPRCPRGFPGPDEARVLNRLGGIAHITGDALGARRAWQAALDILAELDHPDSDELRTKIASAKSH